MVMIKGCLRFVRWFLLAYVLYALIGSTIPHLIDKPISDERRQVLLDGLQEQGGDGDRAVLINEPEDALTVRLTMIREAETSLDIAYHNLQGDDSTKAFFEEVLQAAERGVEIRILLDGKVGALYPEVRQMLRLAIRYPNLSYARYNSFDLLRPWRWHTLMHDKFIIADETYLLLGGRNIGDRYFNPRDYQGHVVEDRDVLIWRTQPQADSVLLDAQAYMDLLWQDELTKLQSGGRVKEKTRTRIAEEAALFAEANPHYYTQTMADYQERSVATERVLLLHNPSHAGNKEPWIGYQVYQLLAQADERVLIQTPYATANRQLLQAMEQVSNQVETQVLTNSLASTPNYMAFSNYYYNRPKFLRTQAAIYEYQDTAVSLHTKAFVIDDHISIIGSLNLDDRSLFIDTETMLVIDSPELTAQLAGCLDVYLQQSLLVTPDNRYAEDAMTEAHDVGWLKRSGVWAASIVSRFCQFLI